VSDFVKDLITDHEAELFRVATSGDWFLKDGYKKYGQDWENHIPRTSTGRAMINLAAQYLFDWQFQDFQLGLYYCPIPDRMVIGARGCGKTTAIAVANALRAVFHPGHNWLHVAPSIEQARAMFDIIISMGSQGNFTRLFVKHIRQAPAPDIFLRSWDEFDQSPQFMFRSIGGHGGQPMELLRSLEAGIISADEAFRTFQTDYYVPILVGMSRGPNHYRLAKNPERKREYSDRVHAIQREAEPVKRATLQAELDKWVDSTGLAKERVLTLSGNAGIWPIWWQRFKWGKDHPDKRWSGKWISSQNIYFTEEQRRFLEQQFEGDPDGLRVEMLAERPTIAGGVFNANAVDTLHDQDIDDEACAAVAHGIPGWVYEKHPDFGLYRYREPKKTRTAYAAGTDPGTGKLPNRNSWAIIWCELNGPPFKIVGLESGNVTWRGQGSLEPWIAAMKNMLASYTFPRGHVAAEASGPQKGVHEVVWPEDLEVIPLNMANIKATLIMQAQLMLERGMFVGPYIDMLSNQLISYEHADKKLDQDFAMAFLSLVYVIWPYVEEQFVMRDTEPRLAVARKTTVLGPREIRDSGRGDRRDHRSKTRRVEQWDQTLLYKKGAK
jgi:hypothetical protein